VVDMHAYRVKGLLEFFGETQWVQYGEDKKTHRVQSFPYQNGNFPRGSQWTRNPERCLNGTQFDLQHQDLGNIHHIGSLNSISISWISYKVPLDLTPGQYVLSFRWDCEQTPQVFLLLHCFYYCIVIIHKVLFM